MHLSTCALQLKDLHLIIFAFHFAFYKMKSESGMSALGIPARTVSKKIIGILCAGMLLSLIA